MIGESPVTYCSSRLDSLSLQHGYKTSITAQEVNSSSINPSRTNGPRLWDVAFSATAQVAGDQCRKLVRTERCCVLNVASRKWGVGGVRGDGRHDGSRGGHCPVDKRGGASGEQYSKRACHVLPCAMCVARQGCHSSRMLCRKQNKTGIGQTSWAGLF